MFNGSISVFQTERASSNLVYGTMPYKDPEKQRERNREYQKKHYHAKKQYYVDKANATLARKKAWYQELKNFPCMDCGVKYPYYVMDFDHRPDEIKEFDVSQKLFLSKEKLLIEIAKCDLVCANCHRIRTHERKMNLAE